VNNLKEGRLLARKLMVKDVPSVQNGVATHLVPPRLLLAGGKSKGGFAVINGQKHLPALYVAG